MASKLTPPPLLAHKSGPSRKAHRGELATKSGKGSIKNGGNRVILSQRFIVGAVATGLATFGLVASSAAVSGAPPKESAPAFELSAADKVTMQGLLDAQLKNSVGGKQIGVNQIAYDNGATILTLPLPGERQARTVDGPVLPLGTPNCEFEYACLYDGTNFDSLMLSRAACGEINLSSLGLANRVSSIHNNQTNNTQTYIMNSSRQILNANRAPSKVNDVGVGGTNRAVYWRVC
ncbi:hypothetical protein ACIBTW_28320 [Micromonospora parva]|uniref:hypothetical protein n=1 Tax=Micromonospora parva TaxID=1464048 RepID=UPI0037B19867